MSLLPRNPAKVSLPEADSAVLVIDPNEEHQALSTLALGRHGFRVTVAVSGREGLRLALSGRFDAIVLDDRLEDLPSLDLLSVLATRLGETPKIFVVGAGSEESAVRALASGATGWLVKTAQYNDLLPSEVGNQIRAARARRSLREPDRSTGETQLLRGAPPAPGNPEGS